MSIDEGVDEEFDAVVLGRLLRPGVLLLLHQGAQLLPRLQVRVLLQAGVVEGVPVSFAVIEGHFVGGGGLQLAPAHEGTHVV